MVWSLVTAAGLPTGNSDITGYQLLWDNGDSGATTFLVKESSLSASTTSQLVVGLTEGNFYRFKIRAVNIYGAGPDSTAASIRSSDVPSKMANPSTARSGLDVVVTLTPPADNGAAITAYKIVLWDPSSSTYVEDLTYCDGTNLVDINNPSCAFSFLYLMSTYSYAVGDLIIFKAQAYNDDGWGEVSNPNTVGATIMTIPVQMSAPVEGAATSST